MFRSVSGVRLAAVLIITAAAVVVSFARFGSVSEAEVMAYAPAEATISTAFTSQPSSFDTSAFVEPTPDAPIGVASPTPSPAPIPVALGNVSGKAGTTILVPITVGDLTNRSVLSYDCQITLILQ
jgi:hypothetical protein